MSRSSARRRVVASLAAAFVAVGCSSGGEHAGGEPAGAAGDDLEAAGEVIDVPIPADGVELDGSLHLPASGPPYHAVAIVHGSGPQSRRGEVPGQLGLTFPRPVPVYEQLAVGLQDRGFAVLTWDKRTCGGFNGCADNDYPRPDDDVTVDTLREDAEAAVDALATHPDLASLSLLGHSKGGMLAVEIAAARDDVDAVVLAGTTPQPIDEVLARQAAELAELIELAGQQGPAVEAAVDEVRHLAEQVAAVADGGDVAAGSIGGAPAAYWRSWVEASRRAPELAATLEVPVLALGGGQDWNAPADQVVRWRGHLGANGEVMVLPDITHALTRLEADDPSEITLADVGDEVDPDVIGAVADWLEVAVESAP